MTETRFQFEAIGTHWQIDIPEELSPSVFSAIENVILERIAVYDEAYSRFRDDTLVAKMAEREGVYELPDDAPPLFSLYEQVYSLTEGKVTLLIGKVMEEAGYDKEYSLISKKLHTPPTISEVFSRDGNILTMKKPALIDIGAAGKGYLVDLVGEVLEAQGVHSYTIDAGGDITHRSISVTPISIGLENPNNTSEVIGVVTLGNQSIAGSAGNRRAWGKFHHIIDPTTLESPTEILATWVVADTTLLADMLATCLFFVPASVLTPHFSFAYVILYKDFSIERSADLNAEFFS